MSMFIDETLFNIVRTFAPTLAVAVPPGVVETSWEVDGDELPFE